MADAKQVNVEIVVTHKSSFSENVSSAVKGSKSDKGFGEDTGSIFSSAITASSLKNPEESDLDRSKKITEAAKFSAGDVFMYTLLAVPKIATQLVKTLAWVLPALFTGEFIASLFGGQGTTSAANASIDTSTLSMFASGNQTSFVSSLYGNQTNTTSSSTGTTTGGSGGMSIGTPDVGGVSPTPPPISTPTGGFSSATQGTTTGGISAAGQSDSTTSQTAKLTVVPTLDKNTSFSTDIAGVKSQMDMSSTFNSYNTALDDSITKEKNSITNNLITVYTTFSTLLDSVVFKIGQISDPSALKNKAYQDFYNQYTQGNPLNTGPQTPGDYTISPTPLVIVGAGNGGAPPGSSPPNSSSPQYTSNNTKG